MLTLTENASTLIKTLSDQQAVTDDAGLRISPDTNGAELKLDLAKAPEATDQVVESAGARVFLEENVAVVLSDKTLDAQLDESGRVLFAIERDS
ncbi:MAG: iron-sulfur cluster assembly accessory protein [Lacisediminihabitans sp.]